MSEAGMWAIFAGDKPLKVMLATEDEVRSEAQVQTNWHDAVSMHQLVTITEFQSAYRQGVEDSAKVVTQFMDAEHKNFVEWRNDKPNLATMALKRKVAYRALRPAIRQLSNNGLNEGSWTVTEVEDGETVRIEGVEIKLTDPHPAGLNEGKG